MPASSRRRRCDARLLSSTATSRGDAAGGDDELEKLNNMGLFLRGRERAAFPRATQVD
jgi:hypothetical protein